MSRFDITVALTAHNETLLAGPTMRSAEAAIEAAQAEGFRVERLIGLDSPSEGCRDFFSQPDFSAWKRTQYAMRDQGRVRNALAETARGRWIAFLDADDLFSENWLALAGRAMADAEQAGERVIAHPELNWIFDRQAGLLVKTPQDDPLFTPYYFYFGNYYDALCMAPRAAYLDHPLPDRRIDRGLAYEDWQWNIETMEAGWRHTCVRDTIIFKRRREMSQNIRAGQSNALIRDLDVMAIDRIGTLGR